MGQFQLTEDEFLHIVNKVVSKEIAAGDPQTEITNMDQSIHEAGMDSLGTIMFFVCLEEVFQISAETMDAFTNAEKFDIRTMYEYISKNSTAGFTYPGVLETIKRATA